ncbi:Argininosuccinate lyase [Beauveria bassiana]|uniref:Argininosuccinate lyase n=1 Tax=Beauveria bassiana TaxID=176275 RepID=A0A2N6NFJ4_BEABA|nr:Argininosuccinate lyase [Beauveria bassiana]
MAEDLGSTGLLRDPMAAVGDGDFVTEFLQWDTYLFVPKYPFPEFSFISMANAYSSGSSFMPYKKNSNGLALFIGKAGRALGHLAGLMMAQQGLLSRDEISQGWHVFWSRSIFLREC